MIQLLADDALEAKAANVFQQDRGIGVNGFRKADRAVVPLQRILEKMPARTVLHVAQVMAVEINKIERVEDGVRSSVASRLSRRTQRFLQ